MPYRAPGADDPRQRFILQEVNEAQRTLDAAIREAERLPQTDPNRRHRLARYKALKREVDTVFFDLDKSARVWAERDIPDLYRSGWFIGNAQTGIGMDFTLPHREAIDVLSFDAYDDVATGLQRVRQGYSDTVDAAVLLDTLSPEERIAIQNLSRSQVAQAFLTGEADQREVAQLLAQDLWRDNPNLEIIDAGGKRWEMKNYTRMLIRTKTANAYNAGTLNKYAEEGVKRVRVFDGVEHDEECAEANGQTWSLRYAMNNVLAHPNCRRAFAPVAGSGSVNKDTVNGGLVLFDRVELGLTALAALRKFRRTGEVNVSSTLARIVIEGVEIITGVPLPIVDGFIMGLANQGLRQADAWVESFIDPVLFHTGIIRRIPTRASLVQARRPETFIDEVAEWIRVSNQNAFGRDVHPDVDAILTRLDQTTSLLDRGVLRVEDLATDHPGGLAFAGFIASQMIDTNRYGQLVGDTLLRVRDGTDVDLRAAFRASEDVLDQMREVKRLHIESIGAEFDDLTRINDDLNKISRTVTEMIADDLGIEDAPQVVLDAFERYGVQPTTPRLGELLEQVREVQREIQSQLNEVRDIARRNRTLGFIEPPARDFVSEVNTLWDINEVDRFADEVIGRFIDDAEIGFPSQTLREVQTFFRNITPDVQEAMLTYIRKATVPSDELLQVLRVDRAAYDLLTEEDILEEIIGLMAIRVRTRVDGTVYLSFGGREFTDEMALGVADALDMLRSDFWREEGDIWRAVLRTLPDESTMIRHIPLGMHHDGGMAAMWDNLLDEIVEYNNRPRELTFSTLEQFLQARFGHRVSILDESGVNGEIFLLNTEDGDFLIKKVAYTGHSQGQAFSIPSAMVSEWLGGKMGGIEVIPSRVLSLNDRQAIIVMPYIHDSIPWAHVEFDELRPDMLRRFAVYDMLGMENDSHSLNYLLNEFTETGVIIDREVSFGLYRGQRAQYSEDSGMMSFPNSVFHELLSRAWEEGDDIAGGFVNEPFAKFIDLTEDEVRQMFILGRDEDVFRAVDLSPGWNPVEWPLVVSGDDISIPAGRVGFVSTGWNESGFVHGYHLTEGEIEFIEQVINDPDTVVAELTTFLEDQFVRLSAEFEEAQIFPHWDSLDEMAETIVENMQIRISRLVDNGVLNKAGPVETYTSPTGTTYKIGDTINVANDQGQRIEGTVISIFENTSDEPQVRVFTNIGLGRNFDEIEEAGGVQNLVINPDEFADDLQDLTTFLQRVERGQQLELLTPPSYAIPEVDPFPRAVRYLETDADGVAVGRVEAQVDIHFGDVSSRTNIVEFADEETGVIHRLTAANMFQDGRVNEIIDSELSRVPAEYRPRQIRIYQGLLETEDGVPAYGFYDADEGVLHISMSVANDQPLIKLDTPDGIRQVHRMPGEADDFHGIGPRLDWDKFREVLRHELGHAVEVGIEDNKRADYISQIINDLLVQFPEAQTRRDLSESVLDIMPDGVDVEDFRDAFEAIVQYRADIIEDVVNTNIVYATKEMLAKSTLDIESQPAWMNRAYQAIKRNEPDSHHEFFAEVWARIAAEGGGDDGLKKVAREMGISSRDLRNYLDRPYPGSPTNWDMASPEFLEWMGTVLRSDVDVLVPRRRSTIRKLWRENGFTEQLQIKVFDTPPEIGGGGFTYDVVTGEQIDTGHAVAILANQEIHSANTRDDLADQFADLYDSYARRHSHLLDQREYKMGAWLDQNDDGTWSLYLDTVKIFDDEVDAASFGFAEQQLAMYNLDTFEEIPLLQKYADLDDYVRVRLRGDPYDDIIARTDRIASVKGRGVKKYNGEVRYIEGQKRVPVSMRALTSSDQAALIDASQTKWNVVLDPEEMRRNARQVLRRGVREFGEDLAERYEFYEPWHDGFIRLGQKWQIDSPRLMAAAAVISPQRDSTNNYAVAALLTEFIARDRRLTSKQVVEVKRYLRLKAKQYEDDFLKPESAAFFRALERKVRVGSKPSDFTSAELGYVLNQLIINELATFRNLDGTLGVSPRAGLINAMRYEATGQRAIAILRGEISIDEGLRGPKVRSFYNNILDPRDVYGNRDVTIDYHMSNLLLFVLGSDKAKVDGGRFSRGGIDFGMKPLMADIIRELFDENWGRTLDIKSDAQLQEILWGLWREGLRRDRQWWTNVGQIRAR